MPTAKKGFLKIDRAIGECEALQNATTCGIFLTLALKANWGETGDLKRGELLVSLNSIRKEVGLSYHTVLKHLSILEECGVIRRELQAHQKTKIIILKYIHFGDKSITKNDPENDPVLDW